MAGIYIHIPYCRVKCPYCNFFSLASSKSRDDYVRALCIEMELRKDFFKGEAAGSLYFGGGTPSLLGAEEAAMLIAAAKNIFGLNKDAEITFEFNPENISSEYLKNLSDAGINRASLGIQSFSDQILQWLGRKHTAETALNAAELLLNSDIPQVGADLIYGIPGLEDATLEQNLKLCVKIGFTNISCYALTLEEKTILAWQLEKKKIKPPVDEDAARQQLLVYDLLTGLGYRAFEISNYALPAFRPVHNTNYWTGGKYIGLGASAHSWDGVMRSWNVSGISGYIRQCMSGKIEPDSEIPDTIDRFNETVMTALRMEEGLCIQEMEKDFGHERTSRLISGAKKFIAEGFLSDAEGRLSLTRSGRLYADGIAAELFETHG